MIITGGENVYPKEVEDILYQHEAVQECIVTSAPDSKWGERVQAAVVLKSGKQVSEKRADIALQRGAGRDTNAQRQSNFGKSCQRRLLVSF